MTHFRLGVVPYVNAMPLWVPFEKHLVTTQHSFTYEKAVPDRLARDLAAGQVDCATLSIVEAMKNPRLRVADGVCIASKGAVETVQLFHQKPLAQCRRVLLDKDSRTSAFTAKLLLNAIFPLDGREFSTGPIDPANLGSIPVAATTAGLPPLQQAEAVDRGHGVPGPLEDGHGTMKVGAVVGGGRPGVGRGGLAQVPLSEYDCFLSIGDKTWEFLKSSWDRTDLGELWVNHTQLPMVWAAWTASETCDMKELAPLLLRAREVGVGVLDDIVKRLSRTSDVDRAAIWHYLTQTIHYKMGVEEKSGMNKLFEMGAELGMLPPNKRIYLVG